MRSPPPIISTIITDIVFPPLPPPEPPPPPPIISTIITDIVVRPPITSITINPCIIDPSACTSPPPGGTPPPPIVIDPCEGGGCTPPPPPPAVEVVKLTIAVEGNGTVTGPGINCGSDCEEDVDAGTLVQLKASPGSGSALARWEGACANTLGDTCTLTVQTPTNARARFAPAGTFQPPGVEIRRAIFEVRWAESLFKGALVIQGRVPKADELSIRLARKSRAPSSASAALVPAKTIKIKVRGTFKKKVKLPADLLPGQYSVKITSKSGLKQSGAINLAAPPEGVVAKAFASAAENGTAATKLTGDQRELWVRFAFAAFPKAGLPLTISWFLNGQLVAPPVQKSSGPTVASFIRASATLPKGTWQAVLQAGDRIVKTVSVQLA